MECLKVFLCFCFGTFEALRALLLFVLWALGESFGVSWEEIKSPLEILLRPTSVAPNPPQSLQLLPARPPQNTPKPPRPLLPPPPKHPQSLPVAQHIAPLAPQELLREFFNRYPDPTECSSAPPTAPPKRPQEAPKAILVRFSEEPKPHKGTRLPVARFQAATSPVDAMDTSHGEVLINGQRLKIAELVTEFSPRFEGIETETNWKPRQEAIITLRKLTDSTATQKYAGAYITVIKGLHGGIIKAVVSLRTTLSTHGMKLVTEAVEKCGSDLDSIVEFIIHPLIKQCGNTKAQAALEASIVVTTVFTHTTYTPRILQHISNTMDEKNKGLRGFAIGWLDAILTKYNDSKHMLEEKNGADTIYKLINKGLTDADATVRTKSEPVYWNFSSVWPARAEAMMETLPAAKQKTLLAHESNPNRSKLDEKTLGTSTTKGHKMIRAATATGSRTDKPSIRDHIKAQKKKVAEKTVEHTTEQPKEQPLEHADSLDQRPHSAGSIAVAPPMPAKPVRPTARPLPARPKTATAITAPAIGTLSSAPKRPTIIKKANPTTATKSSNTSTDLDVTKGADQGVGLNISTDENEVATSTTVPQAQDHPSAPEDSSAAILARFSEDPHVRQGKRVASADQKRGRPLSVIPNPPDSQSRILAMAARGGRRSVSPGPKELQVSGEVAEPELTSGFVRVLKEVVSDHSHELPEHTFEVLAKALKAEDVSTRREGVELGVSLHKRLDSGFFDKVPGLESSEKDLLLYYIAKRR